MIANTAEFSDHILDIELKTSLNVNNICFLKEKIDDVFSNAITIKVNFTEECSELDVTAIQLFYALSVHCNSSNKELLFQGTINDTVKESLNLAGFNSWFDSLMKS